MHKMKNKLKGILDKALSLFTALLVVICIVSIVFSLISKSNGISIGPYRFVVVLTSSMEPSLATGSLALVKSTPEDELKVGDIITYNPLEGDNVLVSHRIISIDDDQITTMGDNNNTPDRPLSYDAVIGKVLFAIPILGYLIDYLKTPIGIVTFVAVVILFEIIQYLIKNRMKEVTNEDN